MPCDLKSNPEEYRKRREDYVEFHNVCQTNERMYFTFTHKNCYSQAFYDFKSMKTQVLKGCRSGLKDDINMLSLYLWPIDITNKNELVFSAMAFELLENEHDMQKLKSIFKKEITENDNPVILIGSSMK